MAQLEQERATELRFFELSIDMICTADLVTGRFVRLNSTWTKTLGFTPDELRAEPFVSFVHPDDVEATIAAAAVLSAGQDVVSFTNRYRTKEGLYRRIEWMSTADLEQKLIYAVARDITERTTAEEALRASEARANELLAQLREQNHRLQRQADALRELTAPVIPLADDVLAMPVVGELDPERARQLIESLLAGVAQTRARVAILDLTGIRHLDGAGADALLRAARAIRLLGATAVLTGISPGIAQTLVNLGADLGTLVTCGTLREGIAFAFKHGRRGQLESARW